MSKSYVVRRFEQIAAMNGIDDFEKDGDKYVNEETQKMWNLFNAGFVVGSDSLSNGYVIGKLAYKDGERYISFSDKPAVHSGIKAARIEIRRLSRKNPGIAFAMLSYIACYQNGKGINPTYRAPLSNVRRKSFRYADDGFGNLIRVNHVTLFLAYKNIFNMEDMSEYNTRLYRWASV